MLDHDTGDDEHETADEQHGHRLAHDLPELLQSRPPRPGRRSHRPDDAGDRNERCERGDAYEIARQEQGRKRDNIADCRDEGRADVVEVPAAPGGNGRESERHHQHDHRGQLGPDDRHHDEIGDADDAGKPEHRGQHFGHHTQRHRSHQGQHCCSNDVLAHDRVATGRGPKGASVNGRGETAAEGAEDVAPHADGSRNQHQQARQSLERSGDGREQHAGCSGRQAADGERREALASTGDVGAEQTPQKPQRVQPYHRAKQCTAGRSPARGPGDDAPSRSAGASRGAARHGIALGHTSRVAASPVDARVSAPVVETAGLSTRLVRAAR